MLSKKSRIYNSARELFYKQGFKETNVSDIAKSAQIGVGTFYNYYASKEQIFFEINMKENEILKKRLIKSINTDDDPVTLVTKIVTQNLSAMNDNPILKEWNNIELADKLEQYFYEHGGIESINKVVKNIAKDLIHKWKSEDKIRTDLDDDFMLSLLKAVYYVDIHKRDIGVHHFPQLVRYLVEFIMMGLSDCKKKA